MEAIHLGFHRMEVMNPKTHPFLRNLMIPGSPPVTGLASGTPANTTELFAHEFALTLSTTLACDVPLQSSCQANDNELDASQWDAFRVSLIEFSRSTNIPRSYVV